MRDLRDILTLTPKRVEVNGFEIFLARPTVLDLIVLADLNEKDPATAKLHALAVHVLDKDGVRVFNDCEEAKKCPAFMATELIPMIEALYADGLD